MELFFRKTGNGNPIVVLHGLYGSSDNWHSIARSLSEAFTVYTVDLRNHGNSPHDAVHTYQALADDVYELLDRLKLNKAIFIGHSMGGKVALKFGQDHPERVERMVIVDISPTGYNGTETPETISHRSIIQSLLELDPNTILSREEADRKLQSRIPSGKVRQFLLKNLKRNTTGGFYWNINIPALAENMDAIFQGVLPEENHIPDFPLLFIKGEQSEYIGPTDMEVISRFYPGSVMTIIPGAGHWIHAEQPEAFLKAIRAFTS
jgi:esterase